MKTFILAARTFSLFFFFCPASQVLGTTLLFSVDDPLLP